MYCSSLPTSADNRIGIVPEKRRRFVATSIGGFLLTRRGTVPATRCGVLPWRNNIMRPIFRHEIHV
jgi:hypothetical protein